MNFVEKIQAYVEGGYEDKDGLIQHNRNRTIGPRQGHAIYLDFFGGEGAVRIYKLLQFWLMQIFKPI